MLGAVPRLIGSENTITKANRSLDDYNSRFVLESAGVTRLKDDKL